MENETTNAARTFYLGIEDGEGITLILFTTKAVLSEADFIAIVEGMEKEYRPKDFEDARGMCDGIAERIEGEWIQPAYATTVYTGRDI